MRSCCSRFSAVHGESGVRTPIPWASLQEAGTWIRKMTPLTSKTKAFTAYSGLVRPAKSAFPSTAQSVTTLVREHARPTSGCAPRPGPEYSVAAQCHSMATARRLGVFTTPSRARFLVVRFRDCSTATTEGIVYGGTRQCSVSSPRRPGSPRCLRYSRC